MFACSSRPDAMDPLTQYSIRLCVNFDVISWLVSSEPLISTPPLSTSLDANVRCHLEWTLTGSGELQAAFNWTEMRPERGSQGVQTSWQETEFLEKKLKLGADSLSHWAYIFCALLCVRSASK